MLAEEQNLPQVVRLDVNDDLPIYIHCPFCGAAIESDPDGGPECPPCSHVAFVYVDCMSNIVHESDDFRSRRARHVLQEWQADDFDDELKTLCVMGYGAELLILEVRAMWCSVGYAFDSRAATVREPAEDVSGRAIQ